MIEEPGTATTKRPFLYFGMTPLLRATLAATLGFILLVASCTANGLARRHVGQHDIATLERRLPAAFQLGTPKAQVLQHLRQAGVAYEDRTEWRITPDAPDVTIFIRWWTGFVFRTDLYLGLDFDRRGALVGTRPWTQVGL